MENASGSKKGKKFDADAFIVWLDAVKKDCSETGHLNVAMINIGHVLIHAPLDPDGLWINNSIAAVLNAKDADKMREGFITAFYNSRGAHFFSAGEEEKNLEKIYQEKAADVESRGYYRLAESVRTLALSYKHDSERAVKEMFTEE